MSKKFVCRVASKNSKIQKDAMRTLDKRVKRSIPRSLFDLTMNKPNKTIPAKIVSGWWVKMRVAKIGMSQSILFVKILFLK